MAAVRPLLIRCVIIAACMLVAWLFAGRHLSMLLDRFFTVRHASLPVSPLESDGSGIRIGELPMSFARPDYQQSDLRVTSDSLNRLVLSTGGHSFTLGPPIRPPEPPGSLDIEFTSEPGDELTFTIDRSFLSWPTPFEFNFMTGHSSSWRRHLYYRLVWKKRSGSKLEMLWRYQQWFYGSDGWTNGMMTGPSTGLIRVDILPDKIVNEHVVVEYITRTKGWKRTDYRIESRGVSADGRSDVVAVIHLQDERSPSPGAGESVELYIDRASHQVTKELGGQ